MNEITDFLPFAIVLLIIFFFIFREFVTWYWKINKIETLLERIERNTRKEGVVYPDDEEYFPEESRS